MVPRGCSHSGWRRSAIGDVRGYPMVRPNTISFVSEALNCTATRHITDAHCPHHEPGSGQTLNSDHTPAYDLSRPSRRQEFGDALIVICWFVPQQDGHNGYAADRIPRYTAHIAVESSDVCPGTWLRQMRQVIHGNIVVGDMSHCCPPTRSISP